MRPEPVQPSRRRPLCERLRQRIGGSEIRKRHARREKGYAVLIEQVTRAPSSLLSVPPELRNAIYDVCFSTDSARKGSVDLYGELEGPSQDLLLACRQTYNEARGFYRAAYQRYWSETSFVARPETFDHSRNLALRDEDLRRIKHITMTMTELTILKMTSNIEAWLPACMAIRQRFEIGPWTMLELVLYRVVESEGNVWHVQSVNGTAWERHFSKPWGFRVYILETPMDLPEDREEWTKVLQENEKDCGGLSALELGLLLRPQ